MRTEMAWYKLRSLGFILADKVKRREKKKDILQS